MIGILHILGQTGSHHLMYFVLILKLVEIRFGSIGLNICVSAVAKGDSTPNSGAGGTITNTSLIVHVSVINCHSMKPYFRG